MKRDGSESRWGWRGIHRRNCVPGSPRMGVVRGSVTQPQDQSRHRFRLVSSGRIDNTKLDGGMPREKAPQSSGDSCQRELVPRDLLTAKTRKGSGKGRFRGRTAGKTIRTSEVWHGLRILCPGLSLVSWCLGGERALVRCAPAVGSVFPRERKSAPSRPRAGATGQDSRESLTSLPSNSGCSSSVLRARSSLRGTAAVSGPSPETSPRRPSSLRAADRSSSGESRTPRCCRPRRADRPGRSSPNRPHTPAEASGCR